jgi:carboxymethylenebutenolidase
VCFDPDAIPPAAVPEATAGAVASDRLTLASADGTEVGAFLARPERPSGVAVAVLPDMRGLHPFYERLAAQLAGQGHSALAVDWYGRTAGTGPREDGFDVMAHLRQLSRERMQDDVEAAAWYLRTEAGGAARAVVALGFCMGGRQAFMAAAPRFGLAGVIGFYGMPGIGGPYGPGPTQHAAEFTAPVLGLFGGADEGIPPEQVAAFDQALTAAGLEHELVSYPGAPHGFFDVAHAEHADASADAWRRVLAFIGRIGRRTGGWD